MSKKRQAAFFSPAGIRTWDIVTLTCDYRAGYKTARHSDPRDQLVFASRGVMTVQSSEGAWVVPPQRAVWIPAGTPHRVQMSGQVAMRTLYLRPKLAVSLPRRCCVVNVPLLLRELILHACVRGALRRNNERDRNLVQVVLDQLQSIRTVPLQLPNPRDARARRVAALLLAQPAERRSLTLLCRQTGASKRTIERLFLKETKLSFGKWRQQLRLMHAMRSLGGGVPVTRAAMDVGYSTPSAFSAAFKKALGTTARQYFRSPDA